MVDLGIAVEDLSDQVRAQLALFRDVMQVHDQFVEAFEKQCVERIFLDLQRLLKPEKLTVYARYVRRGGLDINPYRSTEAVQFQNLRLARQ